MPLPPGGMSSPSVPKRHCAPGTVPKAGVRVHRLAPCPLPDDFSTRPFGFLGSFYVYRCHFGSGLLHGCVLAAQESCLLRKIHVLHERHAALQS